MTVTRTLGWSLSFRSDWLYADACPGHERAVGSVPEWLFYEAAAR